MIWAMRDSLKGLGVEHSRASEIANALWGKYEHGANEWYDLVHSGDKYGVDINEYIENQQLNS